MGDLRKNIKSKAEAAAICCCCLLRYQADNTLRRLTLPLSSHYRSTPSKCKSARFEKASEEIGVPRGKKSERYRSTPHYRSRSLKMKSARFEKASRRKSGYREGEEKSATGTAQLGLPLTKCHVIWDQHILGCWASAISTP